MTSKGTAPAPTEAERVTEELVEKLEHRNIVIAKSRARIEELERELAQAQAEGGDREERITEQIEAERIRIAEREQAFRSELEVREAEIKRRLEASMSASKSCATQRVSSRTASTLCRYAMPASRTAHASGEPSP